MNVEIINVGTELLLGEIVNTNATYIQKMCRDLGFNVFFQRVVGDNPERFKECWDIAFKRGCDCVITTGGLGPTVDDLTKELSAEYLGLEMVFNEEEAKKVNDKCTFVTKWKVVPENNFKQAYFPPNAHILENEVGTANGCIMENDNKMIINLPGPPKEMTYVIDHELKPYLSKYAKDVIYTYDFLTIGIGESRVDELLKDLMESMDKVTIAPYAGEDFVRVRLAVKCKDQKSADELMEPVKAEVIKYLDEWIIKEANLKEALYKIMPAYHIEYLDDFRLNENFVLGANLDEDSELVIKIKIEKVKLGDIVHIMISDKIRSEEATVGLLKDANLSMTKLEARIVSSVYAFIKEGRVISGLD